MTRREDCFICLKHEGGAGAPGGPIYDDSLVFVGHAAAGPDALPLLGHYLVEPKRHVKGIGELNAEEAQAVGLQVTRTGRVLQELSGAEHIYVFVLGHHVEHLHVHVVPRYPATPRKYWGLRVDEWPEAPHRSDQKILEFNKKMRRRLAEEGF